MSQSEIVPSSPQLATVLPSGLTRTALAHASCAGTVASCTPCCGSHQRTVPSVPALSSRLCSADQSTHVIGPLWPSNLRTSVPCRTSQRDTTPCAPSAVPLASCSPSGLQQRASATPTRSKRRTREPSAAREICTSPSSLALARSVPSGDHTTAEISPPCSMPTWLVPACTSQMRTLPSLLPLASLLPSVLPLAMRLVARLQATASTRCRCPRKTCTGVRVVTSQSVSVASLPPLRTKRPSGLQQRSSNARA